MALTWAAMMAAMMLPSALPALVSFGFESRALAFAGSFLAAWVAFGVAAFAAYEHSGLMSLPAYAKVALLVTAAVYELMPLKRACLRRCRANAYNGAALARGARYGIDCLGCCAGPMLALFVVDPMSLAWMIAVSALVLVQMLPLGSLRGPPSVARNDHRARPTS